MSDFLVVLLVILLAFSVIGLFLSGERAPNMWNHVEVCSVVAEKLIKFQCELLIDIENAQCKTGEALTLKLWNLIKPRA